MNDTLKAIKICAERIDKLSIMYIERIDPLTYSPELILSMKESYFEAVDMHTREVLNRFNKMYAQALCLQAPND